MTLPYRTPARRPYEAPRLTQRRQYRIEQTSRWRDPQWPDAEERSFDLEVRRAEFAMMAEANRRREEWWKRVGLAFLGALIVATISAVLRR